MPAAVPPATASPEPKTQHVVGVQRLWQKLYNLPGLATDVRQWDHLFKDGERFALGVLDGSVLFSPGHALASVAFRVGDAAFVHDMLFIPDSGIARADVPGGDLHAPWASMERILSLRDATRLLTGHDDRPGGRELRCESTVAEQKAHNAHVIDRDEASFVSSCGRGGTRPCRCPSRAWPRCR